MYKLLIYRLDDILYIIIMGQNYFVIGALKMTFLFLFSKLLLLLLLVLISQSVFHGSPLILNIWLDRMECLARKIVTWAILDELKFIGVVLVQGFRLPTFIRRIKFPQRVSKSIIF
jgi:hypothetical protein